MGVSEVEAPALRPPRPVTQPVSLDARLQYFASQWKIDATATMKTKADVRGVCRILHRLKAGLPGE